MIPNTENNTINDQVMNITKEEEKKEEIINTEENNSKVLPPQIAPEDSDSNDSVEHTDSDNENPSKRRKLSEEERLKRW
jgi:hypothetical protein